MCNNRQKKVDFKLKINACTGEIGLNSVHSVLFLKINKKNTALVYVKMLAVCTVQRFHLKGNPYLI